MLVAALSTGQKVGLASVGGLFILFALVSSFVLPRRNPNFPGKHLGWFVTLSVLFFVAMLSAVLVFGKEKEEAKAGGEAPPPAATTTEASGAPAAPPKGDAAAGKKVFASAGCGGCHTLKAAGSSGTVGPNLDTLKPPFDRIVTQVENGGGGMPPFKGMLSQKQIDDVSAFVYASTHA
jgi:mono/diheme cytochrome c family protein